MGGWVGGCDTCAYLAKCEYDGELVCTGMILELYTFVCTRGPSAWRWIMRASRVGKNPLPFRDPRTIYGELSFVDLDM